MRFLRRLLGGDPDRAVDATGATAPTKPAPFEDDEATRDRELLRAEAMRLDDDLLQRQLRYADRAWTPPAQGGKQRADDGDRGSAE